MLLSTVTRKELQKDKALRTAVKENTAVAVGTAIVSMRWFWRKAKATTGGLVEGVKEGYKANI